VSIKASSRKTATQRGYGHAWHVARNDYLRRHPLCAQCLKRGKHVGAVAVDHIKAHKGNKALFWNEANWQSLCTSCHNSKSGAGEVMLGCDIKGNPLDPTHPWLMADRQ